MIDGIPNRPLYFYQTDMFIHFLMLDGFEATKTNLLVNNHQDMLEYVSQIASRYCGWKICCTTLPKSWDVYHLSTGAGFHWPIHRITNDSFRILNELVRRRWLIPSRKHEAVPWPGCGDGGWIGSTKVGHP